jgi:hypothetical protein
MKAEAFIKLPRDLLESDAWRALGLHARLLIEFLMIEHMRKGGKRNGFLLAPRRQLVQAGIWPRDISGAIEELEQLGLIDCRRGTGRRPSIYALTWLPLSDGDGPTNRWRNCQAAAAAIVAARKAAKTRGKPVVSGKPHSLEMSSVCAGKGDQTILTKPVVSSQTILTTGGSKRYSPSRTLSGSYHGGAETGSAAANGSGAAAGKPCGFYVVEEHGFRRCGKPGGADGRCAEHARPPGERHDPVVSQTQ